MKIAEVVAVFPPYYGGMGNVCYQNAIGLSELGHEVTVFTSNYPKIDFLYPKSIKVRRLKPLFKIGNASILPGLINIKDFDVIHLHYPFFLSNELVLAAARKSKTPIVVTYHMDVLGSGPLRTLFKLYEKTFFRLMMSHAKAIVVTSIDYAEKSQLMQLPGIKDKLAEVPIGVNTKHFSPSSSGKEIRKRYGLKKTDVAILFVAALDRPHYFKGLENLLNVIKSLPLSIKLLVAGDGDMRTHYVNLTKTLNISNKVFFTGRVSDEELPKIFAAADIFVLPSIDKSEAFGLALLEAMSSGKPLIASDLPGVRTLIDAQQNGLLVTPNNRGSLLKAINNLAKPSTDLKDMGKKSRKRALQLYDVEIVNKKLAAVLEGVL